MAIENIEDRYWWEKWLSNTPDAEEESTHEKPDQEWIDDDGAIAQVFGDHLTTIHPDGTRSFQHLYYDDEAYDNLIEDWDRRKYKRILNTSGDIISNDLFEVNDVVNDLAQVYKDDKTGIINDWGEWIIPLEYDRLSLSEMIYRGFSVAEKDGRTGWLDLSGNFICLPSVDEYQRFSEGLAAVRQEGRYGFVDKSFQFVIPPQFDKVDDFSHGIARVKKDGLFGFINIAGEYIIPPVCNQARSFDSYNYTWIKLGKKYRLVNKKGELIEGHEYNKVIDDSCIFLEVEKDGVIVVIDRETGDQFKDLRSAEQQHYTRLLGGKSSEDNENENRIEEHSPDKSKPLFNVENVGDRYCLKDRDGNILITPIYDKLEIINTAAENPFEEWYADPNLDIDNLLLKVYKDGNEGIFNIRGEVLVDTSFDIVYIVNRNLFIAERNGKIFILKGNTLTPIPNAIPSNNSFDCSVLFKDNFILVTCEKK